VDLDQRECEVAFNTGEEEDRLGRAAGAARRGGRRLTATSTVASGARNMKMRRSTSITVDERA